MLQQSSHGFSGVSIPRQFHVQSIKILINHNMKYDTNLVLLLVAY